MKSVVRLPSDAPLRGQVSRAPRGPERTARIEAVQVGVKGRSAGMYERYSEDQVHLIPPRRTGTTTPCIHAYNRTAYSGTHWSTQAKNVCCSPSPFPLPQDTPVDRRPRLFLGQTTEPPSRSERSMGCADFSRPKRPQSGRRPLTAGPRG